MSAIKIADQLNTRGKTTTGKQAVRAGYAACGDQIMPWGHTHSSRQSNFNKPSAVGAFLA